MRVIRDKVTFKGIGIGYVRFAEKEGKIPLPENLLGLTVIPTSKQDLLRELKNIDNSTDNSSVSETQPEKISHPWFQKIEKYRTL